MKNIFLYPLILVMLLIFVSCNSKQNQTEQHSYLVINAIINKENKAELAEYLDKTYQVFRANGGKPIGKYKTIENLGGEGSPEMVAIIAFQDDQKIRKMMNSKDFENLGELRSRVFEKLNLVLCSEL